MATVLCIETATPICSIALVQNGVVTHIRETDVLQSHAASLMEFIRNVLDSGGLAVSSIDAVAVSKGPGSYTGLRIGVSTAKGLCFALDKPLIGIGTLISMATGMIKASQANEISTLYCPMIDARRMEVYTALFDSSLTLIEPVSAKIIDETSFAGILQSHVVVFAGDGSAKCRKLLEHQPNARFLNQEIVSAANMALLASNAFENKLFEDVAYFEPYYLKDFIAGKSFVKGLR
jgi:tRNA threonylcarbamoyladenosine biosynthesis protein TsaB